MARPRKTLSPDGFSAAFKAASRKLWCLAAVVLGGHALAEDVVQEAAMTALQRLETFDAESNFDAWMAQIVRYTALNHARRHYRSREFGVDELAAAPGAPVVPHASLDDSGQLMPDQLHFDDAVMRALGQVDETPRACFLLRALTHLSYREISEMMGIPEGTAMSHVHRSRATLRKVLEADLSFEPCVGGGAS